MNNKFRHLIQNSKDVKREKEISVVMNVADKLKEKMAKKDHVDSANRGSWWLLPYIFWWIVEGIDASEFICEYKVKKWTP